MPDTPVIDCFQLRRLSDRLNDIFEKDTDVKQTRDDYIMGERGCFDKGAGELANYIRGWLSQKEKFGSVSCSADMKSGYRCDKDDFVVAGVGIGDVQGLVEKDDIAETDVGVFRDGKPCGRGTVTLLDGSELWGTFRRGRRE